MKPLVHQLSMYASYHRDRRNIAIHLVGIPMIVLAIQALLARASFEIGGVPVSPALVMTAGATIFYLRLDLRYGVVMAVFAGATWWAGTLLADQSLGVWLASAGGLFVAGWILQLLGHHFEGRKPAFVDDMLGLLLGPLFIVVETGFFLGFRDDVRVEIERRAGRTRAGSVSVASVR